MILIWNRTKEIGIRLLGPAFQDKEPKKKTNLIQLNNVTGFGA